MAVELALLLGAAAGFVAGAYLVARSFLGGGPPGYKRLVIDFPDETAARLDALRRRAAAKDDAQLINWALAFYEAGMASGVIEAVRPDGSRRRIALTSNDQSTG